MEKVVLPRSVRSSLHNVGPVSWDSVFDQWRHNEEWQQRWRHCWEERGFNSWTEWRANGVAPLDPAQRSWALYTVTDLSVVREFYGVPSRGWSDCYDGDLTRPLHTLTEHELVRENEVVRNIMENFPLVTMLIGIVTPERIILIDGMHRSLALARAVVYDMLPIASVSVALAPMTEEEVTTLSSLFSTENISGDEI